jgi:hypothetical protein
MAKCPNPRCESTEFKTEKISTGGIGGQIEVTVFKQCETIIGISHKAIEELLEKSISKR